MMKNKAGIGICPYLCKGSGLFWKVYYSWTAVPAPGKVNGVNL